MRIIGLQPAAAGSPYEPLRLKPNVGPTRILATMLTIGELDNTFQMYWDDMERCRAGKAYWSLLHVAVCLPDICAALEASDGRTTGKRYVDWCDRHLSDAILSGDERYSMRCKVLHEGRASTGKPGRYSGFAFTRPPSGRWHNPYSRRRQSLKRVRSGRAALDSCNRDQRCR
jgi:hypothetical protein